MSAPRCAPRSTPSPGGSTLYLTDRRRTRSPARGPPPSRPSSNPTTRCPPSCAPGCRYPADLFDAQATAYERFHTTQPRRLRERRRRGRGRSRSPAVEVAGSSTSTSRTRTTSGSPCGRPTPSRPTGPRSVRDWLSHSRVPAPGRSWSRAERLDRPRGRRTAGRDEPAARPGHADPAQISRLVFATPRVSNLLGLRNLEIRDLNKSSLDSVILGRPHLLFLPSGVMQIQSLLRGLERTGRRTAARSDGVRQRSRWLGPDIGSAVRQALNEPPQVAVRHPRGPATVGRPVDPDVPGRERAAGDGDDHLGRGQSERVHRAGRHRPRNRRLGTASRRHRPGARSRSWGSTGPGLGSHGGTGAERPPGATPSASTGAGRRGAAGAHPLPGHPRRHGSPRFRCGPASCSRVTS